MSERISQAEQLEPRVQMLLGIFSAKGVLWVLPQALYRMFE
jgi:hypothetical protein